MKPLLRRSLCCSL